MTVKTIPVRAGVRAVLEQARLTGQPVTVLEVQRQLERQGISYDLSYVRLALNEMVTAGKLCMRSETMEERLLRANGATPTSILAALYFDGMTVPARTQVEVFPGVVLKGVDSSRERKTGKAGRKRKTGKTGKVGKARAAAGLTGKARHLATLTGMAGASLTSTSLTGNPKGNSTSTSVDGSAIDYLVDKLVAERTVELQRRLDEAEATLAQLRRLIGS